MKAFFNNFIYLIKKFKTSSLLIVIGLSFAFAIFLITTIQVIYDFGYDKSYKKSGHIYSCNLIDEGEVWFTMNQPSIVQASERFPEILSYCQTGYRWDYSYFKDNSKTEMFTIKRLEVTRGFLDVFTPEIIAGSAVDVFDAKTEIKAIITEKKAKNLFGSEDPIGKIIFDNEGKPIIITAVCKNFPDNTIINADLYLPLNEDLATNNYSYQTYFELDPKNVSIVEEKFNTDEVITELYSEDFKFQIIPITDIYKYSPERGRGKASTTYILLTMGILSLIIAYINFINFSVAMAPVRLRNINIQKVLGARENYLKLIIISEPIFFSIISLIISFFIISLVNKSFIITYLTANISLLNNIGLLLFLSVLVILFAILIGLYPAIYTLSFKPARALNGRFQFSTTSALLRNILIFIQFVSAFILIIVSLFIKMQHSYMLNYSWEIERENIIYLDNNIGGKLSIFKEELQKDPDILDCTSAQFLPGYIGTTWTREFEGMDVETSSWMVSDNFLTFFGIDIIQGENFSPGDLKEEGTAIIVNKEFVNKYGIEDIIGKNFDGINEEDVIKGIADNVIVESLQYPISPLAYVYYERYHNYIFIKISGKNLTETIKYIEKTWEKFSENKFEYHFLDQHLDNLYKKENYLAKIVSILAVIMVLIAVMGIYGLINFNSKFKEKEIAIRKVNGASVGQIILMLNKNLLIQLIISFSVSIPISYIFINQWLKDFAFHIPVYWWVFLIGGIILFLVTLMTVSGLSYKSAVRNPSKSLNKE